MELEGYEGFEVVGSGGNAHVYRATAIDTGDVVAVKALRGGGDDAVLRRFERERSLMTELETLANVVPIYESGFTSSGDPYLVMPLYTGGSLQDKVSAGPMSWLEAVATVKTLAEAISMAHAKRILHLDLKPANVLLDDDGDVWLSDFGIAEMMGSTVSMSAQMITPAFTPPERLDGAKPSETTDLYGLVATLFSLLTGRAPYTSPDATGPMGVMMAIMREPVPVDQLPVGTPMSVRNLVQRGMAKDPAHRPDSAIELVGLLDDVLAGLPVDPAPAAAVETTPSAPEVGHTMAVNRSMSEALLPVVSEKESEPKRRGAWWLVASVLAVVAVGLGAFALWPSDEPTDTASDVETSEAVSTDAAAVAGAERDDGQADDDTAVDGDETARDDTTSDEVDDVKSDSDDRTGGAGELGDVNGSNVDNEGTQSTDNEQETENGTQPESAAEEVTTEVAGVTLENDTVTTTTEPPTTSTSTTIEPTTTTSTSTTTRPTTTTARPTTTTSTTSTTTTSPTTTSSTTTAAPRIELEAGFVAQKGPTGSEQTISFSNITKGDATSYRWEFGDGNTSTATTPSHTYAEPGMYSVTITAFASGGVSNAATHSVRVDANTVEEPPFEAGWTASAMASPNQQTVNFRSTTIGDASSFTWDFGDGTTGSGETVSHTYAEPGTYSVTLTASGAGGTGNATHSVRVDENS